MQRDSSTLKTFVVYEIWTLHRVVQAASIDEALENDSESATSLSLANWHAVEVLNSEQTTPPRLRAVEGKI